MFDNKKKQDISTGSCYVTKAAKDVYGQLMLESDSEVHSVEILGTTAGTGMKDTKVLVCPASGECSLCGEITEDVGSITVGCPQPPARGVSVRLENSNNRLQICDVVVNGITGQSQSGGGGSLEVVMGITDEQLAKDYAPKACQEDTEKGIMKIESCSDSGTKDESKACDKMFDESIAPNGGCYVAKGSYKVWTELKLETPGTITGFSILGKSTGEKLIGAVVSACHQDTCAPCLTIPAVSSGSCMTFTCDAPVTGDTLRIDNKKDGLFICDLIVYGEAGEV